MNLWSHRFSQNTNSVVRAEILTIFCSYFGRNDDFINLFWNCLTFNGLVDVNSIKSPSITECLQIFRPSTGSASKVSAVPLLYYCTLLCSPALCHAGSCPKHEVVLEIDWSLTLSICSGYEFEINISFLEFFCCFSMNDLGVQNWWKHKKWIWNLKPW